MTKLAILGAAAFAASALASPATARQVIHKPSSCSQYSNAHCRSMMAAGLSTARGYRYRHRAYYRGNGAYPRQAWNNGYYSNGYYNNGYYSQGWGSTGFWPADVAAGAVGTAGAIAAGAVNTAGAIATAPFRATDSYAYNGYNGYNTGWHPQSYAQRNGFVCTPGTFFKGADGRRYRCQ